MTARRYPQHVKDRALALAEVEGFEAAAAEMEIPAGTIRSWATRRTQRRAVVEKRFDLEAPTWDDQRVEVVSALGELIGDTLAEVHRMIAEGRTRQARDGAVTLGILIDKAQLLAGQATSRTESFVATADADRQRVEAARLEVERLRAELGAGPVEVEEVEAS